MDGIYLYTKLINKKRKQNVWKKTKFRKVFVFFCKKIVLFFSFFLSSHQQTLISKRFGCLARLVSLHLPFFSFSSCIAQPKTIEKRLLQKVFETKNKPKRRYSTLPLLFALFCFFFFLSSFFIFDLISGLL